MSDPSQPLSLFQATGVELEYMIVSEPSLNVNAISDHLLRTPDGLITGSLQRGVFEWSNELAFHVLEIKTNGPAPSLLGLAEGLHQEIRQINATLLSAQSLLLPTGAHPWMDPYRETRLWPHEYNAVYEAFDRIFSCQGHGWSNLQSVHLNFPFAGPREFERLHAAIRLLLPLLPAIAASSPFLDGRFVGSLDGRLQVYRSNCAKIPSITGAVVPEAVFSQDAYEREILKPIYRDIAPYDPEAILQEEWLNARGAIARFERQAIEIRIIDIQECPYADLAIAGFIEAALKALVYEQWSPLSLQKALPTDQLADLFLRTVQQGEQAVLDHAEWLQAFGISKTSITARDLSSALCDKLAPFPYAPHLQTILEHGPLARRILKATGSQPSREILHHVYRQLADCLAHNRLFLPS